jgi:hypothetical protein
MATIPPSPAASALGYGSSAGLFQGQSLADQMSAETEEEKRRRLLAMQQQQGRPGFLGQGYSAATASLMGSSFMGTATDGKLFSNISATTASFSLDGGYYMVAAVATFGGGNVELQALGPDGSTWLSAPTALKLSANGTIAGYLPQGVYRFTITTATAVYCSVAAVAVAS